MTGRRQRFKFPLRYLLICVTCISLILAWFTHLYHVDVGKKQLLAVDVLHSIGVLTLPANSMIDFHQFTLTGSSEDLRKITIPEVGIPQPSRLSKFGRRLLGDTVFADFSTIIVQKFVVAESETFQQQISNLPNLNTIYFYENSLDQTSINTIKQNRPDLIIKKLDGIPPQLPQ